MPSNTNPIAASVWMRPPRSRGGQPTLGREQIVRAAVELLDAKGLDGLSMRRLGVRLGAGATSIYWHVTNKDELLELAADEVMGEIELPDLAETDWRTAARAVAYGVRSVILRHGWLAGMFGARPLIGPNAMRMSDRVITLLTEAGFAGPEVAYASSLIMSHAIGTGTAEAAWNAVTADSGKTDSELFGEMEPYLDTVAPGYPSYDDWWRKNKSLDMEQLREDSFAFGVERLLDGLAAWLNPPT